MKRSGMRGPGFRCALSGLRRTPHFGPRRTALARPAL